MTLESDHVIARVARGEPEALTWLHGRCQQVAAPQFSAWAWEWIGEDFVSELQAQLIAAARRDGFAIRGDAGAYVDTSIRNLCKRYFQELARTRLQLSVESVPDSEFPENRRNEMARIVAALEIRRALESLSAKCQELMRRKYVLGQSMTQIGDDLGIQEKTARSRVHSCREHLRKAWRKLST